MKYLFDLNIDEVIDGLVGNYLIPKNADSEGYFKQLYNSIKNKVNYSLRDSVEFVIKMGNKYSHRFTFFVVGKLAEKNPGLVGYLLENGHEVASHSMTHILALRLDEESFMNELLMSREILEEQGAEVSGAASFAA